MNKTYLLDGVQTILSYPFKAPGWQFKFAIGAVLSFASYIIPILPGIVMMGYMAKIMRDTIVDNAEPSLPEWTDWGNLFSRGFKVFGATMVYMLPASMLMIGGYIIMIVPMFLSGFDGSSYGTSSRLVGMEMLGVFGGMALFFLGFIFMIPLSLILPPVIAHVVAKDSFVAAFHIREWWTILRANFWGFFTAMAIISGVYMILFMVVYAFYFTIILCFLMPIGLSILIAYLSMISAVTIGEAYRKGTENLASAASN